MVDRNNVPLRLKDLIKVWPSLLLLKRVYVKDKEMVGWCVCVTKETERETKRAHV